MLLRVASSSLILAICCISGVLSSSRPFNLNENVDVFNVVQPRSANRLLNNTEPLYYSLELTTNIHNAETSFTGVANIRFRPLEPISSLRINSYLLNVNSCSLSTTSSQAVAVTSCATTPDRFLDVVLPADLVAGQEYILTVSYTGTHRAPSEGFHSSYYTVNGQTTYLASTQFQSVFAREAFPCFDEPYYRVPMKLTIRHGAEFNALSNAEVEMSIAGVTSFKETWALPSYLIAFVVSDFECTERLGKQRICAQPNRMGETALAVEASDKILRWMEATFDEDYGHEKLDHIAIPTFQFGGMENWGLVVYHPWYLLFNEGVDTVNDKINVASVIAHELAHMFYGNLITPKWWTYLWLSEGLATLYENYGAHAVYPELRLDELFNIWTVHAAFRADSSGNSRPMTYYVDSVEGIEGIFDSIAYLKAGSVFRMIKYAIGEATFHKALAKYLDANKNTGVDEKPMYEALEAAIVEDRTAPAGIIDRVMNSWSLQGGYPVLTVERDVARNTIHISQKEFITRADAEATDKLWYIPISFTQRTLADFEKNQAQFWMGAREQDVANDVAADDWVIFNLKQTGYYRVNYDEHNWALLIEELVHGDHESIPPTSRAQLVDDINWMADYQRTSNDLRLSLMEYLARETDMLPLLAAQRHLSAMNRMMRGSAKYPLFQKYLRRMVEGSFKGVEKFFSVDEDINTLKSRSVLVDLACMAGMEECLALTRTLMFAELKTGQSLVNKEDREMVYCNALKTASKSTYELFLKKYDDLYQAIPQDAPEVPEQVTASHDFDDVDLMTRIYGCYGDKEEIGSLLRNIFSGDFHYPRFRFQILRSLIANGHWEQVLDYLLEHEYQELNIDELEEGNLASTLLALSTELFNEAQREKLAQFLAVLDTAEVAYSAQVKQNVEANVKWFGVHGNDLETFLGKRYLDECVDLPGGASLPVAMTVLLGFMAILVRWLA